MKIIFTFHDMTLVNPFLLRHYFTLPKILIDFKIPFPLSVEVDLVLQLVP